MSRRSPSPQIVFVPWGKGEVDQHVVLGAAWLNRQEGNGAVFVPEKGNYKRNAVLRSLVSESRVVTVRNHLSTNWQRGPLLVCWPTEKMLGMLSDSLAGRITAACILEWGEEPYQRAWLAANKATDLVSGKPARADTDELSSVVLVAMKHLNDLVNHANGLASQYDKTMAIATLTALVRGGYRFDVDMLCAWALANGFTASEVENLRDYSTKALKNYRFRTTGPNPLRQDIVKVWEAEVSEESDH